uniref:Sulfhydryl oxidase n=1 Tax=Odontella aurita TaxID=265563 RepID=A0A7S4MFC9_9STRA|mmetsp:Transcript_20503/g.59449  ORF Transcript_20503/g.59449 Transcript_20503/m.59449 type:complete len:524 (+) Transcript_20503:312-1883(+)
MRSFSSLLVSLAAISLVLFTPRCASQLLSIPQHSPREIYVGSDPYSGENCPGDYLPGIDAGDRGIFSHDRDSFCVKWIGGIETSSGAKPGECESGCLQCPDPPENCSLGRYLRNQGGCCVVREPCICDDEQAAHWKASLSEMANNRNEFGVDSTVLSQLIGSGEIGKSGDDVGRRFKKYRKGEAAIQKVVSNVDEIAASTYKRSTADVFNDASLSLDVAFRFGIFMSRSPLSKAKEDVLREWINLLKYALPADMKQSHEQLDALTLKFDDVVQSEDALREAIEHVRFERNDWSLACSYGQPHKGYTCGLWALLHIATVGVVETNETQSSSKKVSTAHAADIMRNFIEHFFDCKECREYFLKMYDECFFGRCKRLSTDTSLLKESTRELPLWLSKAHNAVNVRLLRERRSRENKPMPTREEVKSVRWPHETECPHCWQEDGTWDDNEVYKHLKSEYGSSGFKQSKLNKQGLERLITHEGELANISVVEHSQSSLIPLAALLVPGIFWLFRQKLRNDAIGRSKER